MVGLHNSDEIDSRTNAHNFRLEYGYIIYMDKSHIIRFRQGLKERFPQEQGNRDHFVCTAEDVEASIIDYCKLMK